MAPDRITLTLPSEDGFEHVADLVVGGLGARLELTLETLEDLQLAVENLFERGGGEPLTLTVDVEDGLLRTSVGPFDPKSIDDLERDDGQFGLRRILETVCDTFELEERDGRHWVQLTKKAETVV